ncbi:GNAT family N-acetyltransferase [Gammaproteobacteria bacterium]|nr:GNAT family N-acetyltransferase [Gammaproteobacteria bacterium]MDA9118384.1 GNAT family N-acetyltransferase [Gammaproteobacteria bacterium]
MKLREAIIPDCEDLFNWRNDPLTRSMSIENSEILIEDHKRWFKDSLKSLSRIIYIGELNGKKIGVCRFDISDNKKHSEISINLNPGCRGQGVSFELLDTAIKKFKSSYSLDIHAKIKRANKASLKIFKKSGFHQKTLFENEMELILPENTLKFNKITPNDADDLYELLKAREHPISHANMPSVSEHKEFIENNPYLHWIKVSYLNKSIGTIYIFKNNSVGINIIKKFNSPLYISQVLNFIGKFKPNQEKKSLIPEYFYINTSSDNLKLIEIYNALSLREIQVSHKLTY